MAVTTANSKTMKNYLTFFGGQLFSMLGSSILSFTVIWWITVTYSNPVYISIAYFFAIGVQVLVGPIAGVFIDRWNRKKVILVADTLVFLGSLTYVFLFAIKDTLAPIVMLWAIIAVIFVRNIISAFQWPSVFAIIPLMIPKDKLVRFNGLRFVFFGAINIVGPAIGAVLYEIWPISAIIAIDGVTFFIALGPLLLLKIPKIEKSGEEKEIEVEQKKEKKPSFLTEFKEGGKFILSTKGLMGMILIATFINFSEMPLSILRPIFVNAHLGGTATNLALIVSLGQAGMFSSGIFLMLYKRKWKKRTVILMIALYIQIIGYVWQSLTPAGEFWFMGIGAFIMGTTFPFTNTMIQSIMQTIVPTDKQGRITTILSALASGFTPIGIIVSGPLANAIGYVPLFIGGISFGFITITLLWIFTKMGNLDRLANEIEAKEELEKLQEEAVIKIEKEPIPEGVAPAMVD